MIPTSIVVALLSTGPCTLQGSVELTTNGRKLNAGGKVALYVESDRPIRFETPNQTRSILQKGLQFVPKVLVVLKGDLIQFKNEDKDEHGVFSRDVPAFQRERSREGVTGKPVPFTVTGAVRIQCDIHEWMRADVLVVDNPFFTLADADGSWRIPDLPAGKYTLVAWEPNGGKQRVALKKCSGELHVAVPPVEQLPERKGLRRLNNQAYPPYPGGMRPIVEPQG